MDKKIIYPHSRECILNIENIRLKLLIDKAGEISERENYEQYSNQTLHRHAHAEIFCCLKGCLNINTEKEVLSLYKDDIAVIPGTIPHTKLSAVCEDSWAALRFQIIHTRRKDSRDIYSSFHEVCENGSIKLFRNTPQLADTVYSIFRNIRKTAEPYPFMLSLFEVLYRLTELHPISVDKITDQPNLSILDSDMQRIEVLDYIVHKWYMYPLTPAMIAKELHISERQINRIVQSKYGTSFHKVLLNKRILVAEQMLEKSDIRIHEIAQAVGFHSPDIFFREFRKKHGITPREYRLSHR